MTPYGPAALRLCVGAVFLAHGLQKLFGLWGGLGIEGTTALLASWGLSQPQSLAIAVGIAELGGGALLIIGGPDPGNRSGRRHLESQLSERVLPHVGRRSGRRVPVGAHRRAALSEPDRPRRPLDRRVAEFFRRGDARRPGPRPKGLGRI